MSFVLGVLIGGLAARASIDFRKGEPVWAIWDLTGAALALYVWLEINL